MEGAQRLVGECMSTGARDAGHKLTHSVDEEHDCEH